MFKVLVVEDTEEYRRLVSKMLGHYKVTCVPDPDAAWEALDREKFDLIVLDLGLPIRDGSTLLEDLQAHDEWSKIPVVCLTGRSQLDDKIKAFGLGAEDYIVKPFDPLDFRVRIDAKIAKRVRNRELDEMDSEA